jgi:hypothetical protein
VQQRHAVEALGLVEVRSRDDGGDAVGDPLVDDAPQLAARHRVDTEGGLVEQQQLGLVDQRAGEPQLLLHAARELAGQAVLEGTETGEGEEPLETRRQLAPRHVVEVGVEGKVLAHRQVGVEPKRCDM